MTKDDQEVTVLNAESGMPRSGSETSWTVADDGSSEEQDSSTAPASPAKKTTKEG